MPSDYKNLSMPSWSMTTSPNSLVVLRVSNMALALTGLQDEVEVAESEARTTPSEKTYSTA
jgi:hypothetical protein